VKDFNHTFKILLVAIFSIVTTFPTLSEASTTSKPAREIFAGETASRRSPVRAGVWRVNPTVVICTTSAFNLSEVSDAVEWWEDRGYSFERIVVNAPGQTCSQSGRDGFITIEGPDASFDFQYLAITHRKSSRDEILSAKIQFGGPRKKSRILEHEIGHALGWSHCNRRGHIMNPEWSRGGWDDFGLHTLD
jgi:hypothetical protein